MRIFNSTEKSIDLSPTVKLLKHKGNVMFVVFKKNCLIILFLPGYSSNLRYKLKDGLLTGIVLPQIIPIQRWACKSVPQVRAFKLCICNVEIVGL